MDYKELYNIKKRKVKCSVCGSISVQMFPNHLGNDSTDCDLDLRPRGTYRDIIHFNVQECPFCGNASSNIKEPFCESRELLDSNEYKTTDGISFKDKMAELHYKAYLIEKAFYEHNNMENIDLPLSQLMECIWCCDDCSDIENATKVRKIAIELIDKTSGKGFGSISDHLIKADMLRRNGNFVKGEETIDSINIDIKRFSEISESTRKWIEKKDINCHTVSENIF